MRRSVLTILVGAAVVATGCTSTRDSAASVDRPSGAAAAAVQKNAPIHPTACSLLTPEEMATILGGAVARRREGRRRHQLAPKHSARRHAIHLRPFLPPLSSPRASRYRLGSRARKP